ncbi:MAG: NAD(P)H-hydrate dehydratase [Bacteroidaceae bacterium]|nr:NAD(P)H-hydrate dehydratase [Bacteroidaceae bacterium]
MKQEYAYTELADAKAMLKVRDPQGHKGTFGHGLLVAGCKGMAGAAILSARAALRSGMGKLTVHTADFNLPIMQVAVPEAVIETISNGQLSIVNCQLSMFDALAIGPGLGQSDEARSLLLNVLQTQPQRLVIDADGLNLLAQMEDWPTLLPKNAVLTPHPMEWQRLTSHEPDADPCNYAQRHSLYIILKGHATRVYTPQGMVFVNTTGNSGMATAGSGDVLTGILLSLLAQGYSHEDACRLGVWLHGKAGDIAAAQLTEEALIASDIVNHLPAAFKELNI